MKTHSFAIDENYCLTRLNNQLGLCKCRFNAIKETIELTELSNENELLKKYNQLKDRLEKFSLQIHHFEESFSRLDILILKSFNDTIDEISRRIDGVELAIEKKQFNNLT